MNAWIHYINKAEHFIYIEVLGNPCTNNNYYYYSIFLLFQQQFFISSLLKVEVSNGIAEALRLRIARAHRNKEMFRVIVVMPLLPSFPSRKSCFQS